MDRAIRIAGTALLGLSSLAFAAALYWNSDWNWAPVQIPLPGPGLTVDEPFEIATSGTYRFEAMVPIFSKAAIEELPPASCRLEVSIERFKGRSERFVLTNFRAGGSDSAILYVADRKVKLT